MLIAQILVRIEIRIFSKSPQIFFQKKGDSETIAGVHAVKDEKNQRTLVTPFSKGGQGRIGVKIRPVPNMKRIWSWGSKQG